MKTQLYIPKKCKVGFNLRQDTYTGKLGYIIFHDGKVWRKENSWEGWREKYVPPEEFEKKKREEFEARINTYTEQYNTYSSYKDFTDYRNTYYNYVKGKTLEQYLSNVIGDYSKFQYSNYKEKDDITLIPIEFDNDPTEGFVLNKDVGGVRRSWSHHGRMEKVRVYDPRGFEFEITVPNLLYILQETSSLKGKGLEGNFVYSWDGKDLVLLPENAVEYQECMNFTKLQQSKVSKKELVIGHTYMSKKQENLIYMGHFEVYESKYTERQAVPSDLYDGNHYYRYGREISVNMFKFEKKHIFWNDTQKKFERLSSFATLGSKVSDSVVGNYAELMDKLSNSEPIGKLAGTRLDDITEVDINPTGKQDVSDTRLFAQNGNDINMYLIQVKPVYEKEKWYDKGTVIGHEYCPVLMGTFTVGKNELKYQPVEIKKGYNFRKAQDIVKDYKKFFLTLDNEKQLNIR